MAGLYVHIPFCRKKCIYCDFYSLGSKNAPWQDFVDALIAEFIKRKHELTENISTLYIGGGTPSQMPVDLLQQLIDTIKKECGELWAVDEFTVEVNPDDVSPDLAFALLESGVNRVSMGIQSFVDDELKKINRRHSAYQAVEAYKTLSIIPNRSLDLIFGLPGQTLQSWEKSLRKIIELRPNHISAYSLMYEEGTPIYIMREQERIREISDDLSVEMFKRMITELRKSGYVQYEISNFALPSYESKHNSRYWSGTPYLGLGPAAHSYDGRRIRRNNIASVNSYIDYYLNNTVSSDCFYNEEILSEEELYNEYVMTHLRTMKGIDMLQFKAKFGEERYNYLLRYAQRHINNHTLIQDANNLHLSDSGILISDDIFSDLMIVA